MFDLMFCAGALFLIFTTQYGADKGSVEVQGISRKISKNHIFFRLPVPRSGKENAESVLKFCAGI